jgi:hypothetical protein
VQTDYWVILDFRGVAGIVDAMGGIEVTIPEDLAFQDWWYSDDDVTHRLISVPPGRQFLDGYMAVAFSRNRDPNDLARIDRQQVILQAAVTEVFAQGLLSPGRWPGLWESYRSAVKTNVPNARLPGYANLLRETRGNMTTFSVGDPSASPRPSGTAGFTAPLSSTGTPTMCGTGSHAPSQNGNTLRPRSKSRTPGPGQEHDALAIGRFIEFEMAVPTVYIGPDAPQAAASQIPSSVTTAGSSRRTSRAARPSRAVIQVLPRESDSSPMSGHPRRRRCLARAGRSDRVRW